MNNRSFFVFFMCLILSLSATGQNQLIWKKEVGGPVFSSLVVHGNYFYFGSHDSVLYALDKADGHEVNRFKAGGQIRSAPLVVDSLLIFNSSDGVVRAIGLHDFNIRWTFRTQGEKQYDMWDYFLSSPVTANDLVFVGSGDGFVYAIEIRSGALKWKFFTGAVVHATPLVAQGKVFIGSFNGFFYALDALDGHLVWSFKTVGDASFPKGEVQSGAALYNNSVLFGCRDYNIYSLHTTRGTGMWNKKETGSWIVATPLIYNDRVFFGTSDSHRFCVMDAKYGVEKFSYQLNMRVYGEAVTYDNQIFFGCFNGKLYKIDASMELHEVFQTDGSVRNYSTVYDTNGDFKEGFELYGSNMQDSEQRILSLGSLLATPAVDQGVVYLADANGMVYALKLQ